MCVSIYKHTYTFFFQEKKNSIIKIKLGKSHLKPFKVFV